MTLALDTSQLPQDQQEETRVELEFASVEGEATELVDLGALAAAQAQAEFELTMGQILNMATGGQGPSDDWLLARQRALLEPRHSSATQ